MSEKVNLKGFENVITGTFDECDEDWMKMLGPLNKRTWRTYGGYNYSQWAAFSIHDSVPIIECVDDEDRIIYPDFNSDEVICEGPIIVIMADWKMDTVVLNSPKPRDVYRFFANNHDGHHGYLEDITYDEKINTLFLHAGS